MKKQSLNSGLLILVFFTVTLVQGCASSGSTMDNSHIYSQPFNKMANIVDYAIKSGNLKINTIFKSKEENKITFLISAIALVEGTQVQDERGKVIVTELKNGHVQVEVKNPEYPYTIPYHQRKKYDRIIYERINTILNNHITTIINK
ncbi:MAG TPA: hypothetical protein VFG39_01270 [Balneolaceae bacterium]|nr:hypothetical protein [Balneolaceae bacterium]